MRHRCRLCLRGWRRPLPCTAGFCFPRCALGFFIFLGLVDVVLVWFWWMSSHQRTSEALRWKGWCWVWSFLLGDLRWMTAEEISPWRLNLSDNRDSWVWKCSRWREEEFGSSGVVQCFEVWISVWREAMVMRWSSQRVCPLMSRMVIRVRLFQKTDLRGGYRRFHA